MFPVLFQLGPFVFKTAGFFLVLGLVVFGIHVIKNVQKKKIRLEFITDHLFSFFLWGIIGARAWYIIENWNQYQHDPLSIIMIWDGGFSAYGGMLFFLITLWFWSFMKKEDFWKWTDVIIPAWISAMIILSLGDFLSGANYGIPATIPWAVTFDLPEVRYALPIHPTQLYTAAALFIINGLLFLFQRKKRLDGVVTAAGIILYFLVDGILELLRGDTVFLLFDLRFPLLLSFIMSLLGIFLLIWRSHPHHHTLRH